MPPVEGERMIDEDGTDDICPVFIVYVPDYCCRR